MSLFWREGPPKGKEWLITTPSELLRDAQNRLTWQAEFDKTFPADPSSTFKAKSDWASSFDRWDYGGFSDTCGACLHEVMFAHAPPTLRLELLVRTNRFKGGKFAPSSPAQLLGCEELRTAGAKRHVTWEAHKKWLLQEAEAGTALSTGADGESGPARFVLFASTEVKKTDNLHESLRELLCNRLGIVGARAYNIVDANPNSSLFGTESPFNIDLPERCGEMVFFPSSAQKTTTKKRRRAGQQQQQQQQSIAVELFLPGQAQKSAAAKEEETPVDWSTEICRLADEKKRCVWFAKRKNAPAPPRADSEEEEEEEEEEPPLAPETHLVLWLPEEWEGIRRRVWAHVETGEGECDDIKGRMLKGNTDTGNIKIELFRQQLRYVSKILKAPLHVKLCTALSILSGMGRDTYWMNDNEDLEAVEDVVVRFAKYLKGLLLNKHAPAALGIAPPDGWLTTTGTCGLPAAVAAPTHAAAEAQGDGPRDALYTMIDFYADEIRESMPTEDCLDRPPASLSFYPGKARKKRKRKGAANKA